MTQKGGETHTNMGPARLPEDEGTPWACSLLHSNTALNEGPCSLQDAGA